MLGNFLPKPKVKCFFCPTKVLAGKIYTLKVNTADGILPIPVCPNCMAELENLKGSLSGE